MVCFLVQMKTSKSHSEINWPLCIALYVVVVYWGTKMGSQSSPSMYSRTFVQRLKFSTCCTESYILSRLHFEFEIHVLHWNEMKFLTDFERIFLNCLEVFKQSFLTLFIALWPECLIWKSIFEWIQIYSVPFGDSRHTYTTLFCTINEVLSFLSNSRPT